MSRASLVALNDRSIKTLHPLKIREGFESLGVFCKAMADPLRLEILRVLKQESFGVQELAYIFSMPQPGMSHHLKLLSSAGWLKTRRQGNTIFYRRPVASSELGWDRLQGVLLDTVDSLALSATIEKRITQVHAQRAKHSLQFFEKNAEHFTANQGLLCGLEDYLGGVEEMLDIANLPRSARVLEVGPGDGKLLRVLAGRVDHLVALDHSGQMLSLAQAKSSAISKGVGKIDFVRSSLEEFAVEAPGFDAVVMNMVLHHISAPSAIFKKLATHVRDSGYLLIADLGPHNQRWTREKCGDLWPGFDPEELETWGTEHGFVARHSDYLGLKNGFQVQLRLFQKQPSLTLERVKT